MKASRNNIRANDTSFGSAHFGKLSPQQCEKLHNASLEILERTGVRLFDPEAVELLRNAGAFISEENRVRIPSGLVEKAFTTVPKRVVLCNRFGERVIFLEDHRSFYGPGSDCLHIMDHRTNTRRQPVLQDLVEGMTVCDALPNIDFVMSLVLPEDVNQAIAERYQMEAMLSYTTKPIVFVTYDFEGCVDAVEMAEAVVGSPEALRQNPLIACYINVTTGLKHNTEALQKLLYLAGKGLPAIYVPVVSGGMTGPVTLAGDMACVNAGVLTGLVLSQLKREGAPFIMPGWGGEALDMRTMVGPYCAPDLRGMAMGLAHYYNLPAFGYAGASESKLVDSQSGAEPVLTLVSETLAGANLIHDLGYLESGMTYSFVQLVLCDEIVSWIRNFMKGIEINDETLALDLIDKLGPDGQFLDSEHTLAHFRERWYPRVFERDNFDNWLGRGGKSFAERASDHVNEILAEHKPVMLTKDVQEKVNAIVRRAEQKSGG
ncbi:MAG: trimethylamine methyltransferase family protein [Proteobacteria bacterium]|nr:trimethylamine methyltransferase family protein [Pseudomonadota bacterium]